MKSVRSANFLQVNHEVRRILTEEGVTILPSPEAYRELKWTREYFEREPREGYFVWVKKQIDHPVTTCISISSPKVSQHPTNLVVIEKNIEVEMSNICNAVGKNLCGSHMGHSKVVVRENSLLKMRHVQKWGKRDTVGSDLEFFLEKGARLSYIYRCLDAPKTLKTMNNTFLDTRSSANFEIAVLAKEGSVEMHDSTFLNGEKSSGTTRVRMIADEKSRIYAHSKMIANNAGIGHLDCMGLLLTENSSINAIPELINKNKNASLTHEASVGRISEETLNYLRSRGLTEDKAIDLIVTGFLREEAPFTYKGRALPSKLHM